MNDADIEGHQLLGWVWMISFLEAPNGSMAGKKG